MRLNKIEKDLKLQDLKLNFSKFWTKVKIFVGGSFLVANIAACTPAVEDVDATSMAPTTTTESVVPSSSEEVTPSTEVVDSTEVTPSAEVVEPTETTEVVEDTITAEEAYAFVTNAINENGQNAYSKYIPTLYLAMYWDDFTAEERENYQNLFGLSDEDLDNNYMEFMELQHTIGNTIYRYNNGDQVDHKYSADDIFRLGSFIVDEENNQLISEIDEKVNGFLNGGSSSSIGRLYGSLEETVDENSTSRNVFLYDFVGAICGDVVPEKSVFASMQNDNVK